MLRHSKHYAKASQYAMAFGLRGDDLPATICMPCQGSAGEERIPQYPKSGHEWQWAGVPFVTFARFAEATPGDTSKHRGLTDDCLSPGKAQVLQTPW